MSRRMIPISQIFEVIDTDAMSKASIEAIIAANVAAYKEHGYHPASNTPLSGYDARQELETMGQPVEADNLAQPQEIPDFISRLSHEFEDEEPTDSGPNEFEDDEEPTDSGPKM